MILGTYILIRINGIGKATIIGDERLVNPYHCGYWGKNVEKTLGMGEKKVKERVAFLKKSVVLIHAFFFHRT